jgi:hypothetical protein
MQNRQPKIKKFRYMQPKRVNGGVGAKKQSIHHTPIRLSTMSRNVSSEYTNTASFANQSNSKITSYKVAKSTNEKRQSRPNIPISMSIDISTPKGNKRYSKQHVAKSGVTIINKCGNTLLNLINRQTPDGK